MIEEASVSDLNEIAEVHKKCFQKSFLTKYGRKTLSRYYGEFMEEGGPFVIAKQNSAIVGFCMGYVGQSDARNRFLRKHFLSMAIKTLGFLLTFDKTVYKRICSSIMPSKGQVNEEKDVENEAFLLSICVLEEKRGTGLSKQLVEEFEKQLIERKCNSYVLFAEEDNDRGIAFYNKMGYKQVRRKDGSIKFYKRLNQ